MEMLSWINKQPEMQSFEIDAVTIKISMSRGVNPFFGWGGGGQKLEKFQNFQRTLHTNLQYKIVYV